MKIKKLIVALVLSSVLSACTTEIPLNNKADIVFHNGKIYTVNPDQAWADTIAIKQGRYQYIGNRGAAEKWIGPETRMIDLQGKMMMPGINDAHSHPFQGGSGLVFNCDFSFNSTPAQVKLILAGCLKKNPDLTWLEGGQWTSNFFKLYDVGEPIDFLDSISTDVAIYLEDDSGHNAWVNSKALMLAGIDGSTADPKGGTISRNVTGKPNGVLLEMAAQSVAAIIPERSVDEYSEALTVALQLANSFGLTATNEARTPTRVLQAYHQLEKNQRLTAYVTTSLQTPFGLKNQDFELQSLIDLRERYHSDHVNPGFVKIFSDGVPTASRSAFMLENYTTDEDHPHPTRGTTHLSPDELYKAVLDLDAADFVVKIHTAGDGSVRMALDAIERVRVDNGNQKNSHRLAHAGYINEADFPRFKALNVIADFSPYIWFPSPIIDSLLGAVPSPRAEHYFPTRTLLDIGAPILTGSDWPSAVETPNPWPAIEAIISRKNPFSTPGYENSSLWPEQAINLEEALKLFTLSNARAMKLDKVSGSIELGKSADFIVLNNNLFDINVNEISETQVLSTWFEGREVYVTP